METKTNLAQWLEEKCQREHLSLRRAAGKTGLSHATITGILRGARPSAVTIMKLAKAFSADGQQRLALEDRLLTLAGYRTPRPEGVEPSMAIASLVDKVSGFSEPQLETMCHFADFLIEATKEGRASQVVGETQDRRASQ